MLVSTPIAYATSVYSQTGIHNLSNPTTSLLQSTQVHYSSPPQLPMIDSKHDSCALPQNLALTFNQIGHDIPTFADAAAIAGLIFKPGAEHDNIVIEYNNICEFTLVNALCTTLVKGHVAETTAW